MVVPVLLGHFEAGHRPVDPGVVHQDIDAAEFLFHPFDTSRDLIQVANVHVEAKHAATESGDLSGGAVQALARLIRDGHRGALRARVTAMPWPNPVAAPVTSARLSSSWNSAPSIVIFSLHRSCPFVPFHADLGGNTVGQHALDLALPLGYFAHQAAGGGRHLLVGHGLEELADPQPARIARGTTGRRIWFVPIVLSP